MHVPDWTVRTAPVPSGLRYQLFAGKAPLTFAGLFSGLETDPRFAAWYSEVLSAGPWKAFFWEFPGICAPDLERAAEFVLIDAPLLANVTADPGPFQDQLSGEDATPVATFSSLGGDALLLAPLPRGDADAYAHLAAFVRHAPREQVRELWRATGAALLTLVSERRVWLSTSGLGVHWLHIRLDSTPKYYQHTPYARAG
jgi:hypothetical protein